MSIRPAHSYNYSKVLDWGLRLYWSNNSDSRSKT
ncbi:hypothetical protein A2U01_0043755, partial [Trifolium medium]|nr:hypothetical protein [Trifolium medium]